MLTSLDSGILLSSPDDVEFFPERTVCITGHREKSIIPYMNDSSYFHLTRAVVRMMLFRYIAMALEKGYTDFFSGLAEGTDLWAAEYLLLKKNVGSNIRLIGAMPFLKHSTFASVDTKRFLQKVENGADCVVLLNNSPEITYGRKKEAGTSSSLYKVRNYFMVDNSSAVLGFFDGRNSFSGTSQTVYYAEKKHRKVRCFGLNDAYRIIRESNCDFDRIRSAVAELENIF